MCNLWFRYITESDPAPAPAAATDAFAAQGNSDTDSDESDADSRPANRKARKRITAVPIAIICPEKRCIKKPKRYTDE